MALFFPATEGLHRINIIGAAKSPAQSSRPGSSRTFGEYALLEDSRYMSQEGSWRNIMNRKKLRQFRGLRSVHDGEAAFSPSEQTNRAYRPVFRAAAAT
jgi:hypothetical protein